MASAALILAAGKGTRMKSSLVKVMHLLDGEPMVAFPLAAARQAGAEKVALVLGHQGETVRDHFSVDADLSFFEQAEQLGTGHAVACALSFLKECDGELFILCGDVPLIRPETLAALRERHLSGGAVVTILTARVSDPTGYGRIITDAAGRVIRIVEEKDANEEERRVDEINSGIYCVEASFLRDAVTRIGNDNAQEEYYLTDIIAIARQAGLTCLTHAVADQAEVMGVNDRVQLAEAAAVIRSRVNRDLMLSGVTLIDPATAYVGRRVRIGRDSVVHPGVHISGATVIGEGCIIEPGATISDCVIADKVQVKAGSVLEGSTIGNGVAIGPMAHLRPGTALGDKVKIGNFVETKKAVLGYGSKASHLTYLGDAVIGRDVNVGCGTITCNYDGVNKHTTVIEDGVFVGSDVQLVAPVTVGRNSLIAAGTTVTRDVPADSLAISRTPQVNKEGWVANRSQDKGKK